MLRRKLLECCVCSPGKRRTVSNACSGMLPGLELYLALQVYVTGNEDTIIDVVVKRFDADAEFRMVCKDVVRRLALLYQRSNNIIYAVGLLLREVDSGAGIFKGCLILPLSKGCAVSVLVRYRTQMSFLRASVADIRRLGKSAAFFLLKVFAVLVADRAGRAVTVTDNDAVTDIGTLAAEPFGTEVVRIIEYPFGLDIIHPVKPDFLRYGGWILAKEPGNVLEGSAFIQLDFDVFPVRQGEVFLVTWN